MFDWTVVLLGGAGYLCMSGAMFCFLKAFRWPPPWSE